MLSRLVHDFVLMMKEMNSIMRTQLYNRAIYLPRSNYSFLLLHHGVQCTRGLFVGDSTCGRSG